MEPRSSGIGEKRALVLRSEGVIGGPGPAALARLRAVSGLPCRGTRRCGSGMLSEDREYSSLSLSLALFLSFTRFFLRASALSSADADLIAVLVQQRFIQIVQRVHQTAPSTGPSFPEPY